MAWEGQCKFAFGSTVEVFLLRSQKKKVRPILKQLSQESGIPLKTLERWWQNYKDEKCIKNEANEKQEEKTGNCEIDYGKIKEEVTPICPTCRVRPVRVRIKEGKKHFETRCLKCREMTSARAKKTHKLNCPHCGQTIYLWKSELIPISKED